MLVEDHPMNIHVQFGKCLLLRNYKYYYSQTVHECSLDGPLQTLGFLFRYEIQNGGYGRLGLTLDPMGKMFQNASSLKPLEHFPIGSNANLCPAVVAILNFRSA
jgi:hypothetical protein